MSPPTQDQPACRHSAILRSTSRQLHSRFSSAAAVVGLAELGWQHGKCLRLADTLIVINMCALWLNALISAAAYFISSSRVTAKHAAFLAAIIIAQANINTNGLHERVFRAVVCYNAFISWWHAVSTLGMMWTDRVRTPGSTRLATQLHPAPWPNIGRHWAKLESATFRLLSFGCLIF